MEILVVQEEPTVKKSEKEKAVELAVAAAQRQLGKEALFILGEWEPEPIPVIPSGSPKLDKILGVGGWPKGRIVEIYGPESSGKTTITLHAIAECQKQGGVAAFIDAEHALDVGYARALGVNVEKLVMSQPSTAENALTVAELLVRSGAVDLVVIDSVAALVPRVELEGQMGDAHVGLVPRLMSQALRKLTGAVSQSNCVVIFINQIREKIGVMFGNPETTPGGRALKFYASVRCEIRKQAPKADDKEGTDVISNPITIKIVKNKVAPPFQSMDSKILYGEGFDVYGELLDLGVEAGVVTKSGSWYSLTPTGERIGQGKKGCRENLKQAEAMVKLIKKGIEEHANARN